MSSAIAGLDLGASCGYALIDETGNRIRSGTWKLGKRSGKTIYGFATLLEELFSEGVGAVGYEKVRRHRGVNAAHAYGGYEAVLWLACFQVGIPEDWIVPVTVQEIKTTATTLATAEKEAVEGAAMNQWCYVPVDDNDADAIWCAEVVRRKLEGEIL